jgi:hypothetical protein
MFLRYKYVMGCGVHYCTVKLMTVGPRRITHARLLFYKIAYTGCSSSKNRWRSLIVMDLLSHSQCSFNFALHSTYFISKHFLFQEGMVARNTNSVSLTSLLFHNKPCADHDYRVPWKRGLLEKLTITPLFKNFPTFCGTKWLIIIFTQACH